MYLNFENKGTEIAQDQRSFHAAAAAWIKFAAFLTFFVLCVRNNQTGKSQKISRKQIATCTPHHFNGKLAVSKTRILPIFTLSCFLQSSFQYKVCTFRCGYLTFWSSIIFAHSCLSVYSQILRLESSTNEAH